MSDTANNATPNANPNINEPLHANSLLESTQSTHESQLVASTQTQPNLAARLVDSQQVPKTIVVQQIPLKLIKPNPDNRLITQDMIDDMATSLAAVSLKNPIKTRRLQEDGFYPLFSGHIRRLAALQLGWETIATQVLDITEEEAVLIGILDNRNKQQTWLDDYRDIEAIEKVNREITIPQLSDRLEMGIGAVNRGKRLLRCLNQASRDLINQSITKSRASKARIVRTSNDGKEADGTIVRTSNETDKAWELTENPVYRLTYLKDPETVFKTLQVLIEHQLTEPQAQKLVEWIQAGNPPETFDHKATKTPSPKKASPLPSELANKVVELGPKTATYIEAHSPRTGISSPAETQPAHAPQNTPHPKPQAETSASTKTSADTNEMSDTEVLFWDVMVGVSIMSQIKAKVKKREKLTGGDILLLAGHYISHGLAWLAKHGYKVIGHILKFFGKLLKGAVKGSAKLFGKQISGAIQLIVTVAFLCGLAWIVWDAYHHGLFHPFRVIGSKLHLFSSPSPEAAETSSAPQAPPTTVHPTPAKKTAPAIQAAKRAAPLLRPWNPADLDKNYLEEELTGVPPNSVIKPYLFQPNFNMGSDMAYHRLMDLQLPEKYSTRWGTDKEKVTAIISGASNMTLTMQSDLVGAFLGGSTQVNIYWEDLKAIYTNVIESPNSVISSRSEAQAAKIIYQISLNLADSKKPLTIQCANPADLEHLVSALEFYIKLSRGNTAPIGGLPYPNQGLRLDDKNKVTTLWADSPMDKAGMALGEILWSLEKYTDQQQSKTEIEAGLQSLTPGPHILFKVTAEGWKRALANTVPDQPETFHPLRRKVSLVIE